MQQAGFWKNARLKGASECWTWTGARWGSGYGCVRWNGRPSSAHRVSWVLHFGEIPGEANVLHKCDNPLCVNPRHLFLGDASANAIDRETKGRGTDNRGTKSVLAKLTASQVRSIRKKAKESPYHGLTADLARKYKMSDTAISFIINGHTYKEVV